MQVVPDVRRHPRREQAVRPVRGRRRRDPAEPYGNAVDVDIYLVAEPTANMLEVGNAVQEAVSTAVEHILGMHAQQVNVYIEDVA